MPRDGVGQAWRFSGAYTAARTVVQLNWDPYHASGAHYLEEGYVKMAGGPVGKEQCRGLGDQCPTSLLRQGFCAGHDQGRASGAAGGLVHQGKTTIDSYQHHFAIITKPVLLAWPAPFVRSLVCWAWGQVVRWETHRGVGVEAGVAYGRMNPKAKRERML